MPQAFVLKPVGDYGHRLVLDIYPVVPPDPLMAFLNENATGMLQDEVKADNPLAYCQPKAARGTESPRKNKPEMIRLITVAIDPGHGGEDPAPSAAAEHMRKTSHSRLQGN